MKYNNIISGNFISRPNRFIAIVDIDGREEACHVKNTGRCRELLVPGARVYLEESSNPKRKTRFSLVAVEKETAGGSILINMDSQAPNFAAEEWLRGNADGFGLSYIAREQTWGESRFDFYLEYTDGRRGYLEVKGVTLENDGLARFPDAPTVRGARHLKELAAGQAEGLTNALLFVIQMKGMKEMRPNDETDPDFTAALREAAAAGVRILAMDCIVKPDSLVIDKPVKVKL
ncbi:MAG: DNA/RNA nuclease SfsA [Clostridiales bacterium]|nr:DNA/RNA nuclease SfsA [Clostridiales bacterium]